MVVSRGKCLIIFNFSQKTLPIAIVNLSQKSVVYNETEEEVMKEGDDLLMGPLNCIMFEE
jgi:hypothetical protein